ncbi:hypothetical protein CVT25_009533 [Psilocybe cyanescens]|uniref:Uncharacterized protein n=1 Tax=Psilocybe cyanescens TaxID=93625 RepID=A0A409X885_PSICY|nr:hypothetical protein CVT25_009533 [Psilocybe cyanescens]
MFENMSNIIINGGTFAEHQHKHQHGPSSSLNINSTSETAIDLLMEPAFFSVLHNLGKRFDPSKCYPNTCVSDGDQNALDTTCTQSKEQKYKTQSASSH